MKLLITREIPQSGINLLQKYPKIEIFSGENSPNNLNLQVAKTYRQVLIELENKKDKNFLEKIFYEFCKFLKKVAKRLSLRYECLQHLQFKH